ncbi:hypothetical protein D5018_12325 [Parashewanella curva]|uniref:Uncharacterized protein n=2 Tax=Parashewanella curva TaxID=2338552 RepID=A0A3L8PZ97_9GAMM|nr:hypothetical protein D5018_12325 [Parashewanella curva]
MKAKTFLFLAAFSICHQALALPDLSEPNDVLRTSWDNVIEIINTRDSTILECRLIADKLQGCKSKTISGLHSPYRAVMPPNLSRWFRIFVTQKDTSNIFSFRPEANSGMIDANTTATRVTTSPFDGDDGKILDLQGSQVTVPAYKSPTDTIRDTFYLTRETPNSAGQFSSVTFNISNDNQTLEMQNYPKYTLPVFDLVLLDAFYNDHIIGLGDVGDPQPSLKSLYPFSSKLNPDGHFVEQSNQGGNQQQVKTAFSSDAYSIAKVNGKYWVTYKTKKKFTKFDSFPTEKAADENSYQAPENSHVTIRQVVTQPGPFFYNLAVFADDDKVGTCTGSDDLICTDAFRYLGTQLSINDGNDTAQTSFSSNSLGDHGRLIFRNLNYSPLNINELKTDFNIPDELKSAFSGSCLDKVDFSPRSDEAISGNDACTLDFDFRKLTNLQPISESFNVGFSVIGPFGNVPTQFHFNIDLPAFVSNFQFEQNENPLSQLHLNAGDSGDINVVYFSNNDETQTPELSFLDDNKDSQLLRSYFADIGCLSPSAPQLASGEKCTLRYRIPAAAVSNQNYSLKLNNSNQIPTGLDTLNIDVSSSANIIAHSPYGNHNNETLSRLSGVKLQPGSSTTIRFTNVGAATAHHFNAVFTQPNSPIPLTLTGDCTHHPDLEALGGSCDLTLTMANDTSVNGKYEVQMSADDYTGYDIPVVIGAFSFDRGIGVSDGHNGLQGTVNIAQTAQGYLKVTNYTGYPLDDLTITLPDLKLSSHLIKPSKSIFYETNAGNLPSCIHGTGEAGDYHVSLDQLASCEIAYHVYEGVTAEQPDANIVFKYPSEQNTTSLTEMQAIHLTNQNAVVVSYDQEKDDISSITLDASRPSTKISITNNSGYTINNLTLTPSSKVLGVVNKTSCQNQSLKNGQSCEISLNLDDQNPLLGDYVIELNADNLQSRIIPFSIKLAHTDNVEVDNRGGYSMSIDYINFHPNTDGNDGECKSGPCYAKSSTGWFTNPFNSHITDVSGRDITMYMMLGTSVTLPSCNQGKIVCTGTTFGPDCHYVGDGSGNNGTPQNQCLQYNPK